MVTFSCRRLGSRWPVARIPSRPISSPATAARWPWILPGEALAKVVDHARGAGLTITAASTLSTAPRGYPKDHPRIELLRMKGLVTWKQWPVAPWLATAKAKDRVVSVLRDSAELAHWLDVHVGPSEAELASREDS